jgi:hypothetical protein
MHPHVASASLSFLSWFGHKNASLSLSNHWKVFLFPCSSSLFTFAQTPENPIISMLFCSLCLFPS